MAIDLSCLAEDLGHLYLVAHQPYRTEEFYFVARVLDCQELFAGLQNSELFSMRVSDPTKYYCQVPSWWARGEVPILLIVPTRLILTLIVD